MKPIFTPPRIVLLLLALLSTISASADLYFTYYGIPYMRNSDDSGRTENTVQVYNLSGTFVHYKGDITIPSIVKNDGKSYPVTGIGEHAFYQGYHITSVTLPPSIKWIGESAFFDCDSLTEMILPESVEILYRAAFLSCSNLESITLGPKIKEIGAHAFNGCWNLKSIVIPESVTTMGDNIFTGCRGLKHITLPSTLTTIPEYIFSSCTELNEITIPASVTDIGNGAFYGCSGLLEITCLSEIPPTCGKYAFNEVDKSTCILHVPEKSITLYQTTYPWNEFTFISTPAGINSTLEDSQVDIVGYYNLQGVKLSRPVKGVNIVVYSDGSRRKVMM